MNVARRPTTTRVGVVVSRFPKFTETFVVGEINAFESLGTPVEIHPLLGVQPGPQQPEAERLVRRAHFRRPYGLAAFGALVRRILTTPTTLLAILGVVVRETWSRPAFTARNLVLLPRICLMANHMQSQGVTHVHAHFATNAGFAAWAIGRLTGLPYSVVAHGSDIHRHQRMLATKVSEAEFVATVSEFNRSVIVASCGSEVAGRVHVLPLGVDLEAIEKTAPRRAVSGPVVICVGTLHEVKGQRHAVEAAASLAERGTRIHLELIGDGEDRADLQRQIADCAATEFVHVAGALVHSEVLARIRGADVVVVPSVASADGRKEGLPTVIIESMACGTPVVASDLAGISELVQHERTGLLVEPGDSAAIADATERLLVDESLRSNLVAAARSEVQARFDRVNSARRMLALINRDEPPGVSPRDDSSP